jgi:outer membrane protein TolC
MPAATLKYGSTNATQGLNKTYRALIWRFASRELLLIPPPAPQPSVTMKSVKLLSRSAKIVAGLFLALPAQPAFALQPLSEFLESGRKGGFDAREQAFVVEQREWERRAALGRLLPSLSARGVYQYNQYEVQAQLDATTTLVISPQNQVDGFFQLDVPIIDAASHRRHSQAKHLERASEAQQDLVLSQVDTSVARSYFILVGASALMNSAEASLKSAEDNASFVTARADLGAATDLDSARALANVEAARQQLADATLGRDLAARQLETLSGLTPAAVEAVPEVSLESEGPLSSWLEGLETPADRTQKELTLAANEGRKAAKSAWLPVLSANAQERLTNATGFAGQPSVFTLQAVLSWRGDYTTHANAKAQTANAEAQAVREEKTRRSSTDQIFEAHHRVETGIVKVRSARAQADATRKAALLAEERYRAGAATQLDVTQAQRDSFAADAALVQAGADLTFARVQLRSLTSRPLDELSASLAAPRATPTDSPEVAPASKAQP